MPTERSKITASRQEARRIMRFINKGLKQSEVVHHKDCNPFNNDPDNLVIMSRSDHKNLHVEMRKGLHVKNKLKEKQKTFLPYSPVYIRLT